jgi:UPF0716 protein FxsA
MGRLFVLFTVVPALELALLLQIGATFGAGPTFAMLLLSGFVGAALARQQGAAVLAQLRADLQRGLPPGDHVVEGALVLAGGLLLLTPGLLTDLLGLALLVPASRRALTPWMGRALADWGARSGTSWQFGGAVPPPQPPPAARTEAPRDRDWPFDHPVA